VFDKGVRKLRGFLISPFCFLGVLQLSEEKRGRVFERKMNEKIFDDFLGNKI